MKDILRAECVSPKEVRKMMKLSQFIMILKSLAEDGKDPEVTFESYERVDNLEKLDYQPRVFEMVSRQGDQIIITTNSAM